ncbi:hypothetical protein AB0N65_02690 [Paenarthrobacter sp. NPDC089322]|uniref:hypothetical protein n=1 Tax=Paenarthrobacter sp. NPDC089322 TaxID=3155065 RepID=UPI00343AC523
MTSHTVLRILRRRWYAAVAVLLLGLAGLGVIRSLEPVYWAQVEVSFVAGNSDPAYWIPGGDIAALVPFAALVERRVNDDSDSVNLVMSRGTLHGAGVKQGFSVTLPNAGGQWTKSFSRPVLVVQVVDSSAERVNQVLAGVIERINDETATLQEEGNVRSSLISTVTTPSSPEIIFGGGTQTDRLKGAGAWLFLTGAAAVAVCVALDNLLASRRRLSEATVV